MDLFEAIKSRRSVRQFRSDVPAEPTVRIPPRRAIDDVAEFR
ncbi:MAG: hypothetical protein WC690_00350 [bacterium]